MNLFGREGLVVILKLTFPPYHPRIMPPLRPAIFFRPSPLPPFLRKPPLHFFCPPLPRLPSIPWANYPFRFFPENSFSFLLRSPSFATLAFPLFYDHFFPSPSCSLPSIPWITLPFPTFFSTTTTEVFGKDGGMTMRDTISIGVISNKAHEDSLEALDRGECEVATTGY
jgi:hypothetical protein